MDDASVAQLLLWCLKLQILLVQPFFITCSVFNGSLIDSFAELSIRINGFALRKDIIF